MKNSIKGMIIYGAGNAGIRLAKKIKKNHPIKYFVDDDNAKTKKEVLKIKVISFEELKLLSKNKIIPSIIVAIPSLNNKQRSLLFSKLYPLCENVFSLPSNKELIDDKIEIQDISNISFTDIISRKNIDIDFNKLTNLKQKNILITGAAGSIGSELSRQISKLKPNNLVMLDHSESSLQKIISSRRINEKKNYSFVLGNILDTQFIFEIIKKKKIDIIYHAAAYKHVDILEDNIIQATKNNIFGTLSVLYAAKKSNRKIKFINISTDKVVQPIGVLGYTKGIAEIICENLFKDEKKLNISTVRFGNVFASDGSVFTKFLDQIKKFNHVELTHKKMERYFMSIEEACYLLLKCSKLSSKEKVFILNMGKPIKIIDLVQRIFKILNRSLKIKIIGMRKGEKLKEILSYKKFNKTIDKNIYSTKNPVLKSPNSNLIYLLNNLEKEMSSYNEFKLRKLYINFFKEYEKN